MKKLLILLLVSGAAFVAGYWPEHRKWAAAEDKLRGEQAQLAEAQSRVRAGELLGRLLNLEDAVAAKNYGQAQDLSTAFFDALRTEATRAQPGSLSEALQAMLGTRDAVTAALVRADPGTLGLIRQAEARLRNGLGFPEPPSPAPAPPPTPGS